MKLKDWVPEAAKNYIKLQRARRRYPGRVIGSHLISDDVILGIGCSVARDVELYEGVRLGDHSYVNAGTIILSGQIGKFCSIAYFCQIGMAEHPTHFVSTSSRIYGAANIFHVPQGWNDYAAPPIIENDVWIGSQAIILQGVRVGNGAIVAAGAVVTRDVAPYTIVAGVPARPVRKRFDDATIAHLLAWQWWDRPIDELKQLEPLFREPPAQRLAAAFAHDRMYHAHNVATNKDQHV